MRILRTILCVGSAARVKSETIIVSTTGAPMLLMDLKDNDVQTLEGVAEIQAIIIIILNPKLACLMAI